MARNPLVVLAVAVLLPGFGHVLCGHTRRGLTMQLFMIVLAVVTWHLTPPDRSLIGRLSGGIFIYALSIPEAYRLARLRAVAPGAPAPAPAAPDQAAWNPAAVSSER